MRGLENNMWECYAAEANYVMSFLNDAAEALQMVKSWTEESLYKEDLVLLRESDSLHAGQENDWSEPLKTNQLNLVASEAAGVLPRSEVVEY